MKKILLTLLSIAFVSLNYGQCIPDAYAVSEMILCNDSTDIITGATGGGENFSCGGPCNPGWSSIGTQYDDPYIPSPDGNTYMWMGPATTQPRQFVTPVFNTTCGGNICFDFVMAPQNLSAPTEGPDLSEEGISLQYSNNGGPWIDIVYFMPNGQELGSNPGPGFPMTTPPFSSIATPYTVWNSVCKPIPLSAQTPQTSFRWYQELGSQANFDHWGIDDVNVSLSIDSMDVTFVFSLDVNNVSTTAPVGTPTNLAPDTMRVSPHDSTWYVFLITNAAYTTTNVIFEFDTVLVYPAITDAGPDLVVSCSTLGVELGVTGVMPYSTVVWTPIGGLDDPNVQNPYANPVNDTMYTVTSDCGVDSIFVNVVPIFEPYVNTPNDSICVNDSATLIATSDQPANGYTYEWTNNVQDDSTATTSVMPTINTMYYLEMVSDSGCIRQDSIMIFVGAVPKTILFDGEMRVCKGDSTQITVNAIQPTFFDDFDGLGGANMGLWADIQNGTANTDCGSVSGNALHFNNGPDRWAELVPVEVLASGGNITFDLFYGNGFGTACSFVGFFERMELQYLNPTGTNVWEQITQYAIPAGVWTHIVDTIPIGAAGPNTSFRFVQLTNGGINNDNWAIDNLLVELDCSGTGCVNYSYDWTPISTVSDPSSLNPFFFPSVTTTYSLSVSPDGFNCNAAAEMITISVDELVLNIDTDYTFLCSPAPILLEAEIQGFANSCNEQYSVSQVPYYIETGVGTAMSFSCFSPTSCDDGSTAPIILPFIFEFYCTPVTSVIAQTNGMLNMTDNGFGNNSYTNSVLPQASTPNGIIALMWDDLHHNNGNSSYFTTGTAPNRKFVIYYDLQHLANGPTVQGQIILHETTNIIDISCIDCQQDNFPSATQGIENFSGTVGHTTPGRDNTAWSANMETWRFIPSNSSANFNYDWIAGSNISDVTSLSPIVTPTQSSEYIFEVLNINNCAFYDTANVDIFENATTLTANTDICIGATLQLEATGADTYVWTPNVSLTDTSIFNPVTSTNSDITYYVEFNTQGCIANDSVSINVLALPVTDINNATDPVEYCEGLNTTLFVDDLTGWSYSWSGPESGSGNSITVTTPGTYTVEFNDGNCIDTRTVTVIENANPAFDFSSIDGILCCTDDSTIVNFVTIANNITIADIYWNGVLANGSSETIFSNEANYVESNILRIVSDKGCENEEDVPDVTTKCADPIITNPDTIFSGTGEVFESELTITDATTTSYEWSTTDNTVGSLSDQSAANPVFNGVGNGSFQADLTVTNTYGNKNCVETAETTDYIVIDVNDPQFPDAFTPDNDNLNEVYKPVISSFATIKDFRIYNRWGHLVYNMETAENKNGWDGSWNGVPQKDDAYTYYMTIEHPDKTFIQEGVVNLIR